MKKRIAILGSTGSIGTQALEVIEANKDHFDVEVLVANNNIDLLIRQARIFKPNHVVVANENKYKEVSDALSTEDIKVFTGKDAVCQIVEMPSVDIVLTAMVGYAGLEPTIRAIQAKKNIALANKETLVVAGELIRKLVTEHQVQIIPVDSEHSAIFQCLAGEFTNPIEKIYLTGSGGPFRGKKREDLQQVSKADALKHPNWNMGNKVTIDSASLMNKGLEAIEARWLFDLSPEQVDVIIHPQSIIHSIVQFTDGSMKAQMGLPDMRLPIQYALSYPDRLFSDFKRFDFMNYPSLTFEKPDTRVFRNLDLAFFAMKKCGNMPCILNAANEIVVDAFLQERISFMAMPDIIEKTMATVEFIANPTYECLVSSDMKARRVAASLI